MRPKAYVPRYCGKAHGIGWGVLPVSAKKDHFGHFQTFGLGISLVTMKKFQILPATQILREINLTISYREPQKLSFFNFILKDLALDF